MKRTAGRAFANRPGNSSGWAFTWLGVGVAALLSFGSLLGVKDQEVAPVVLAGNAVCVVVGLFLGAYLLWFEHRAGDGRDTAEADFMTELDELDQRAPTTVDD